MLYLGQEKLLKQVDGYHAFAFYKKGIRKEYT